MKEIEVQGMEDEDLLMLIWSKSKQVEHVNAWST